MRKPLGVGLRMLHIHKDIEKTIVEKNIVFMKPYLGHIKIVLCTSTHQMVSICCEKAIYTLKLKHRFAVSKQKLSFRT